MKKNYFKIAASGLLVFLMVACGLQFSEITFSSHDIYPGDYLTVDMTLTRVPGDDGYGDNKNIFVYFGARVPEDWNAVSLKVNDRNAVLGQKPEETYVNSEFYAALLQLCYPKEGFKWVAFQSPDTVKELNAEPLKATLVVKSAESTGTYKLDFAGGSSTIAPAELYKDGKINYSLVFNNKKSVEIEGEGTYNCVTFQQYLMNVATLTQEEIDGRVKALDDIKVNDLPISPVDVPNRFAADKDDDDFDLSVNVATTNTGIDEVYESSLIDTKAVNGGIEVVANGATATVYDMAGCIIATEFVNGNVTIAARPGAYIVRVIEGNRSLVNKVIVK
ncbi:MAG: T9SS type A sorting domain-containing protein [Bacteroides sp.]|nr:T9SS type A sorting domain-containing protein [Bacteroides sp.]